MERHIFQMELIALLFESSVNSHFISAHLSDGIGEDLNDLVMRCGDHTLSIDFNDAVPNTNASSLRYTSPHQTTDLQEQEDGEILKTHRILSVYFESISSDEHYTSDKTNIKIWRNMIIDVRCRPPR